MNDQENPVATVPVLDDADREYFNALLQVRASMLVESSAAILAALYENRDTDINDMAISVPAGFAQVAMVLALETLVARGMVTGVPGYQGAGRKFSNGRVVPIMPAEEMQRLLRTGAERAKFDASVPPNQPVH